MLKISLHYDLPAYDPQKHDPDKTFAFLTYRGVHYAKRVNLKSLSIPSWKVFKSGQQTSLFLYLCKIFTIVYYDTLTLLDNKELRITLML